MKLTRDLTNVGGLWTGDQIETRLEELNATQDKRKAVITQLKYHKTVLGAKGDRKLFVATQNKKELSLQSLISNLKMVLEINNYEQDDNSNENKLVYKSEEERKEKTERKKHELLFKLKNAEINKKVAQTKSRLDFYIASPDELVGKSVQHRCAEDGDVAWFSGKITPLKIRNGTKTVYDIVYDLCPEEVYSFPLLTDIKNNDLYINY